MFGCLRCSLACVSLVLAFVVWKFLSIWPQISNTICCYDASWCKFLEGTGSVSRVSAIVDRCDHSHGFSLFDTKGYVAIPSFLSAHELMALKALYHRLPNDKYGNGGNNIGYKSPGINHVNVWREIPSLHERINNITAQIARETATNPIDALGRFTKKGIFINTNASEPGSVNFAWHQDHDSYFETQNHNDYLNFYIMLEKNNPNEAGLDIIPWDRLRQRSHTVHDYLIGKGAAGFFPGHDPQYLREDEHDRCFKMRVNFNDVYCTPQLLPGDVLIMRGDVIHRTQPHNSSRIAFSVRVHPQQHPFDPSRSRKAGYEYWRRLYYNPHALVAAAVGAWQIDNMGELRLDLLEKWLKPDGWHMLLQWLGDAEVKLEYYFRLVCHDYFFYPFASPEVRPLLDEMRLG